MAFFIVQYKINKLNKDEVMPCYFNNLKIIKRDSVMRWWLR
jgi:hypothetical protein